jgi:hypothetical protein
MIANMNLKLYTESHRDPSSSLNTTLALTRQMMMPRVHAQRGFYASFF